MTARLMARPPLLLTPVEGPPAPAPRASEPRIVALGGGTGLPVVLRGLKDLRPRATKEQLTAIVATSDDGGSSGRLRAAYRVPPPGDIRNCLLALAAGDPRLAAMFDFRFGGDGDVAGHSLGNLILTALAELEQDFASAVAQSGDLLAIRGRVLPGTLEPVSLSAELDDGSRVEGESQIAGWRRHVRWVALRPATASLSSEARGALETADLVVIGPGSLYTSLIAVLLLQDVVEAVQRSRARGVMVMNLMTEPGETDGHTAADHVLAVRRHVPGLPIHDVLLNTASIPGDLLARYAAAGAQPVPSEPELLEALGFHSVSLDLLAAGDDVRHDPEKLARALLERVA